MEMMMGRHEMRVEMIDLLVVSGLRLVEDAIVVSLVVFDKLLVLH